MVRVTFSRRKQVRIAVLLALVVGYITFFWGILSSSSTPQSSSSSLQNSNHGSVQSYLNEFMVSHQTNNDKKGSKTKNKLSLGPIFYNIYIPPDHEKQPNAIRIIKEQMIQREISQDPKGHINFVHIGGGSELTDDFCRPHCTKALYKEEGNEVDTLQVLWEYCQSHEQEIVTYIHNKGSFHNNNFNDRIRQMATKAALDCRVELAKTFPAHRSQYNSCAARLTVLPQYLSSGNMWSAKCQYVKGLLPPQDYAAAMQKMYDETLFNPDRSSQQQQQQQQQSCLKPIRFNENHLGTRTVRLRTMAVVTSRCRPCRYRTQ